MLHDQILAMLSVVVLLIASYADLKTREVPDWLSYGFIFAALGIRSIFSLQLGWEILLEGVIGFAIFFLLACLFYYTGQWGGGDSKLLMGMGALLGVSLPFSGSSFTIFWFLLSLLFLGSIYGLIWMVITSVKKRKVFAKEFYLRFNKRKGINYAAVVSALVFLLLGLLVNSVLLIILFFPAIYFLLIFVNTVEKSCFVRNCRIEKLTEGDWLSEDVFAGNEMVMEKKTLQREDIRKLSLLNKGNKINYVKVKDGVPFVPSFLIAYLAVIFAGEHFGLFLRYVLGY